jgi:seryl-tRNA synthetase
MNVHVYHHSDEEVLRRLDQILDKLAGIERKEDKIIMNQQELAAGLKAIQTQVGKVATEQANRFDALTAKVTELQAAIDAGTVTPEVTDAMTGVQTALQTLDDVIPDAPVV